MNTLNCLKLNRLRFHIHFTCVSKQINKSASSLSSSQLWSQQSLPIATNLSAKQRQLLSSHRLQETVRLFAQNREEPLVKETVLDDHSFENICEETLDGLTEYFEELVELDASMKEADISYSSGVLTITLGNFGTYVINKQSPNKQIWLSSPTSGPKRYDFNVPEQYWVYKHTGETLHQLLQREMSTIFRLKNIDFSHCAFAKL